MRGLGGEDLTPFAGPPDFVLVVTKTLDRRPSFRNPVSAPD